MRSRRRGSTGAIRAKSGSRKTRSSRTPNKIIAGLCEPYIDALLKSHVVLDRDEARALYAVLKDTSLPNDGYDVTLRAIRKLGAAE